MLSGAIYLAADWPARLRFGLMMLDLRQLVAHHECLQGPIITRGDIMRPPSLALLLAVLTGDSTWAQTKADVPAPSVTVTVHAGKQDRRSVPVVATLLLPQKSIEDNAF